MMETNFLSVVALTKAVLQGMLARNRGHIVNMSSIAGKEAYQGVWAAPGRAHVVRAACSTRVSVCVTLP
jgi:3-hydroxy acid dehydrogenase/malonic semialdehyde reductase